MLPVLVVGHFCLSDAENLKLKNQKICFWRGKNHLVISQGTEHHRPLDDAATEDFDVRLHHVVDDLKAPKLAREEAPILELLRKQMWSGQLQMGEDEAETS